jgi:acetaldehyde dehydrogenase/alcohol dehydrogenase
MGDLLAGARLAQGGTGARHDGHAALGAEAAAGGSFAALGIPREAWTAALAGLTLAAFEDPSGRTNPRMPMLAELTQLLEAGYGA